MTVVALLALLAAWPAAAGEAPSTGRRAAGNVTTFTDPDGVVTEATYTRSGLVDTVTRPRVAGGVWELAWYTYEDDGRVEMASRAGVVTRLGYDDLRRREWTCEGYASTGCARDTQHAYDADDRVVTATVYASGSSTLATAYAYDDLGQLAGVTHPDGTSESWTYARSGHVAGHLDEEGVASAWGHDDLGRPSWEDLPRQGARAWTYTQGVPSGTSGLYYTEARRDEPDGGSWFALHDFAGRAVYEEDPYGDAVTREFEGTRLVHEAWTSSTGTTLAHAAYGYGRPQGDAERAGRETRSEPAVKAGRRAEPGPGAARQSAARGPAGGRLSYRLGPADDATYSALGSATPDPLSGDYAVAFTYSAAGRALSRQGPGDLVEWDWVDGVLDWEAAEGVGTTTYSYDPVYPVLAGTSLSDGTGPARSTAYAYDVLGRVEEAAVSDGTQAVVTAWQDRDAFGRPRQVTRRVDGVLESSRLVGTDLRGRVTTLSLSTPTRSGAATYQYYDDGQLYSVEAGWSVGGSASLTYTRVGAELELAAVRDNGSGLNVATFALRDDLGRATVVVLGTGALVRSEWDLRGRVAWREARSVLGGYRAYTYAHDSRGRVESVLAEPATATWTREYDYLEPGFLEREVLTTATGVTTTDYVPDAAFNRLSRTVTTGSGSVTTSYAYGRPPGVPGLCLPGAGPVPPGSFRSWRPSCG